MTEPSANGNAGGGSQASSSSAGSGSGSTSVGTGTGTGTGNSAGSGSGSGSATPTTAQAAVEAAASRLDSASSTGSTGTKPAGDVSSSGSQAAAASQTGQAGRTAAEQYHVPPPAEWERILGNARTGAVGGLMQELGVQSKEELTHAIGWMRQLRENPREFLRQLTSEVGEDEPEEQFEDPEPDLRSEDGKSAYSAGHVKQIVANAVEQVRREFRQMVNPALQFAENGQRAIEEAAVREEGESVARDVWSTLSKMPHFTENRKRIGEVYASIPAQTRQRVGSAAALHMAYNKVLAEEILPNLDTAAEEKALAKFRKDANASQGRTSVTTSTDQKPAIREGNVDDLAAHMAQISARLESGAQT